VPSFLAANFEDEAEEEAAGAEEAKGEVEKKQEVGRDGRAAETVKRKACLVTVLASAMSRRRA
jgi:hypothetical protein